MGGGELLHIFDAHTQSWEYHEDGFRLFPPPAMTLSSLLTSSGPYHKKTKISDIGQGKKDSYFIVVGTECHFDRYDRVFAAVVDFDGVMSDLQYLRDPLPAGFRPLGDCKVIDLLEEDEQDDDGHLSSIFCVVYISCDCDQLALSVFRVSLLSPMVVVTPTDEPPYLSRQDKGEEEASDDESGGGDSLNVDILEKRIYALGDAYPNELSDAFFL
ncbi:unnamed protein product [Linum trigynum]|uniref:F-box protein n=1 Tax=Linum trigynum TaxID=586398 RepID=A0AAV2GD68_9ROSI